MKKNLLLASLLVLFAGYAKGSDIALYLAVKSGDVEKVKSAIFDEADVNMEIAGKRLLVEAIDRVISLYPAPGDNLLDKTWVYLKSLWGGEPGLIHLAGATTAAGFGVAITRSNGIEAVLSAISLSSLMMIRREAAVKNHMEIVEQLAMSPKLSRTILMEATQYVRERLVKIYEGRSASNEVLLEIDRVLRVAAAHADVREYRKIRHHQGSVLESLGVC